MKIFGPVKEKFACKKEYKCENFYIRRLEA